MFRLLRLLVLATLVVACHDDDGGPDPYVPTETRLLGMNDVSILVPLPAALETPALMKITGDGAELLPRDLFSRLVETPSDTLNTYDQFHVVAVRFDLCDRAEPGPCPAGIDGRVRLVLQPLLSAPDVRTFDVAVHAFYPIPAADLALVVDELRALAELQNAPLTAPLGVSPALAAGNADYAARLRELVGRYATAARTTRLTMFGLNAWTSAVVWNFRGEELVDGAFAPIVIPDVAATDQDTILVGADTSYDTTPVADDPAGFAVAISEASFAAAPAAGRMQALEALVALQNPMTHNATSVQCIGCHVATFLTARRSAVAAVDPISISGRYQSTYDLSNTSAAPTTNRSLRGFGWIDKDPAITQRVINDTAQVLVEIEERFPPAPSGS